MEYDCDEQIDKAFSRVVDVEVTDGHLANDRTERYLNSQRLKRALVLWFCRAHPKAKVATLTFETMNPFLTLLIRRALSIDGPCSLRLKQEFKVIIKEQMEVWFYSELPADAIAYRQEMLDTYLPLGVSPKTTYR